MSEFIVTVDNLLVNYERMIVANRKIAIKNRVLYRVIATHTQLFDSAFLQE